MKRQVSFVPELRVKMGDGAFPTQMIKNHEPSRARTRFLSERALGSNLFTILKYGACHMHNSQVLSFFSICARHLFCVAICLTLNNNT